MLRITAAFRVLKIEFIAVVNHTPPPDCKLVKAYYGSSGKLQETAAVISSVALHRKMLKHMRVFMDILCTALGAASDNC